MKYLFALLISAIIPLCATTPLPRSLRDKCHSSAIPHRILYFLQQGQIDNSLQLYKDHCAAIGGHDLDLLQHLGLILLDKGFHDSDPEVQLMSIFGAGISSNEKALYILEEGIMHAVPEIQLASMNFISGYHNDYADQSINYCLRSNHLLIRLEATFHLCKMRHPKAVAQAEALMAKVDPVLYPLFPQLFALVGSNQAIKILKKLMANQNEQVRVAAIQSAAKYGRDDLLPQIRILSKHHQLCQQEICAVALGELRDHHSIDQLRKLSVSQTPSVKLAALLALHNLGDKEAQDKIVDAARAGYLPAIYALGGFKESGPLLETLVNDGDIQVRMNAALALLELRNPHCLPALCEILIKSQKDLALMPASTIGKGLRVWKVISSAAEHYAKNPVMEELCLGRLEEILAKTIDLPESDFLKLSHRLLETQQNALAPTVISLLERLRTPQAIALLKSHQQQAGAPLIRNYCTLALFRLDEEGPYEQMLRDWINKECSNDLIKFRPMVPWETRAEVDNQPHQLAPQETSRLLIETFETLAQKQNDYGINVLLEAIKNGNLKNRYALAGLLLRTAQ